MKRFVFGIVWFVVFWLGSRMLAGGVIGAIAGSHVPADANSASAGMAAGFNASLAFFAQWGWLFIVGALIASIVGTVTGFLPGTRKSS